MASLYAEQGKNVRQTFFLMSLFFGTCYWCWLVGIRLLWVAGYFICCNANSGFD